MPLNNFGLVTIRGKNALYRSAQPDEEGLQRTIRTLGVLNIFKLNGDEVFTPARESELAAPAAVESDYIDQWKANEDVARKVVAEIQAALLGGSVLVHCQHGRDRTGFVCGAWRILADGWSLQATLAELDAFGVEGIYGVLDASIEHALTDLAASTRTP